ncbi:MAG TPA: hypothetical protein VNX68_12180 [Nitrosopumilaceae archaeon]|nr:hypothetical protein [Nitrosopumilaceae archaeon]
MFAQPIRNGKFYCRIDDSKFYDKEEWTLKLFAVNVLELTSVKTHNISSSPYKKKMKKVKEQFYKGMWEQDGDTIKVNLDFNADSVKKSNEYDLRFIKKGKNLELLRTLQIKNIDYSDIFYGQSIWMSRHFRQSRKVQIRARF